MPKVINPKFYFFYHFINIKIFYILPCVLLLVGSSFLFPKYIVDPIIYLFGYFCVFVLHITTKPSDFWCITFVVIGISMYPVILRAIFLLIKKYAYKHTTFSLDDTGITYTINFIIFSQKHVRYTDIKEINLNQGPLQRLFKLATIKITTHATTANAGIELYNIKPYHEVYDFLMTKTNTK